MPKSRSPGRVRRKPLGVTRTDSPGSIEGQIAEICRELAVQAKRMRQLHEQADELRLLIGEGAGPIRGETDREPASRGGRR